MDDYELGVCLAYRGKEDCQDVMCTRIFGMVNAKPDLQTSKCYGWHCYFCEAPCSSQGHTCPATAAAIKEAGLD